MRTASLLAAILLVELTGSPAYAGSSAVTLNQPQAITVNGVRRQNPGTPAAAHLVRLRGVVTAFSGWENSFFLQDATGGISVDRREHTPVEVGDQVEVTGTIQPGSFAPIVVSSALKILGRAGLPHARPSTYEELSTGSLDSQWVEMKGVIQSARVGEIWGKRVLFLDLRTAGGPITAHVINYQRRNDQNHDHDPGDFANLVDNTVRVRGVCGSIFNGRHQLVGVRLFVPAINQIIVESPSVGLARLPHTPLEKLLVFNTDVRRDHRVRTSGTVTFQKPGDMLYIQDKGAGICVRSSQQGLFDPGTRVEVFGFVGWDGYSATVENALIQREGWAAEPAPVRVSPSQMIAVKNGFADAPYDGLLVRIQGKLVERLPQTEGQLWLLEWDNVRFQAELGKSGQESQIEPGSTVDLTGICRTEADEHRNPRAFRILLRSRSDITVLRTGGVTASVSFLAIALAFVLSAGLLIWSLQGWDLAKTARPDAVKEDAATLASPWDRASRTIALLVAAIEGAVLIALQVFSFYRSTPPDYLNQNPVTACALLLAAAAVWLVNSKANPRFATVYAIVQTACAGATVLLGGLEAIEYLTGRKVGLTGFLQPQVFHSNVNAIGLNSAGINPGRMTLATALAFVLLGFSLLILRHKLLTVVAQVVTLITAALCVLGLNSCMYGIHDFPGIAVYAAMGLQSAVGLFLLSLALLFCRPDEGPMRALSSHAPGGLMARRLLPCALLAPSVLGFVRWKIQLLGFYDTAFGLALFTSANALSFTSLIWTSSSLLNRLNVSRERAERESREREEDFRALLESAPDAMILISASGQMLMFNAQAENIFGFSDEEMLNDTVDKLIPGTFQQQITGWLEETEWHSRQVGGLQGDVIALRKDGSSFPVEITISPIHSSRGRLIIAAVRDITARKQVEAKLLASEQLYRTTIDSLPQIVWTCLPDGRSDFTSHRWREYTGLPADRQLEEDAWASHIHPDDLPKAAAAWQFSLTTGERLDAEFRMRNAAGRYHWFRVMAVPMRDAENQICRWFGTSTDIEDYKRAEAEIRSFNETLEARVAERTAALRDSEERFRSIIDGVKDYSIIALDPNGNVTSWNSGAASQKGYSAEEVLGRHFSLFYPAEDRLCDLPAQHLSTAIQNGECGADGWRVRKNGSCFWANVLITAMRNEDGELRGFSKITRDMSERKRDEDLLQSRNRQLAEMNAELSVQTQRAEQAARAKSEFLAAMSHEIRTPMNAILAMAEVLWESELSEDQRQLVDVFRRNSSTLLTLINDILDFSKIESGQLDLECITFDLARVIRHATDMAKMAAQVKGIELTIAIAPAVPPYLIGDPTRLKQIILNLLNNAVKFTSQGRVTLTVAPSADDPALLEFAVTDTGIGIREDKLDHIFDKFSQADSSTTRKFGGTGLGLSICKSLSERMGGRIWVTSVFGQGSTFHFTVKLEKSETAPAADDELPDSKSASASHAAPAEIPLRILVAEDTPDNCLVIQLYLKGLPHTLTFAENGQQAVELVSKGSYDLILMDLQMPVLDGLGATRAIRLLELQRGLKATPIVALSADAGAKDKIRCLEAGCTDHFAKPISMRKLLNVIRKYSRPAASPVSGEEVPNDEAANEEAEVPQRVLRDMKKLVPAYLARRRKDASKLIQLAAENDFGPILALAHQLKGSGTTYGFPDLTRLAAALEAAAESKDSVLVNAYAQDLATSIDAAAQAPQ